jgi:hypothetical protein
LLCVSNNDLIAANNITADINIALRVDVNTVAGGCI